MSTERLNDGERDALIDAIRPATKWGDYGRTVLARLLDAEDADFIMETLAPAVERIVAQHVERAHIEGYEKGLMDPGSEWMKVRNEELAEAWDEGFTKAGRLLTGLDSDPWPPAPNPYRADREGQS